MLINELSIQLSDTPSSGCDMYKKLCSSCDITTFLSMHVIVYSESESCLSRDMGIKIHLQAKYSLQEHARNTKVTSILQVLASQCWRVITIEIMFAKNHRYFWPKNCPHAEAIFKRLIEK